MLTSVRKTFTVPSYNGNWFRVAFSPPNNLKIAHGCSSTNWFMTTIYSIDSIGIILHYDSSSIGFFYVQWPGYYSIPIMLRVVKQWNSLAVYWCTAYIGSFRSVWQWRTMTQWRYYVEYWHGSIGKSILIRAQTCVKDLLSCAKGRVPGWPKTNCSSLQPQTS